MPPGAWLCLKVLLTTRTSRLSEIPPRWGQRSPRPMTQPRLASAGCYLRGWGNRRFCWGLGEPVQKSRGETGRGLCRPRLSSAGEPAGETLVPPIGNCTHQTPIPHHGLGNRRTPFALCSSYPFPGSSPPATLASLKTAHPFHPPSICPSSSLCPEYSPLALPVSPLQGSPPWPPQPVQASHDPVCWAARCFLSP